MVSMCHNHEKALSYVSYGKKRFLNLHFSEEVIFWAKFLKIEQFCQEICEYWTIFYFPTIFQ